jgi:tRNA uracil 4-sulfurtransferase
VTAPNGGGGGDVDVGSDVVVLRFAEIFLKGGNRRFFEQRLADNARHKVLGLARARVERAHGRVFVTVAAGDMARAVSALAQVFGVQSLSAARTVRPEVEAIAEAAVRVTREALARRGDAPTFKVEARRADKTFPLTSVDLARQVGGRIVAATGLKVDVHRPQLEIGVEIGAERSFVYADVLPGPGGLPVGSSGAVNLLLSGGIDSPVAGWLAMKRGCTLAATYFHSFPYTGDKTKEKVIDLVRLLVPWHGPPIALHVVGFTEAQKALRDAGPAELAVVLYRRMMMRAAGAIARREGQLALVTGENLAQVASQTLENLAVIEDAAPLPVLRPLVTNDKLETIALARRIGTYETSILPYDDCCSLFVPTHPATRARLADVAAAEARLPVDEIAEGLAAAAERITVAA